jgi:hypothetical protein
MERTKVMRIPVALVPRVELMKQEYQRQEALAIAQAKIKTAQSVA